MKSRDSRLREHMLAVGSQFEGLLAEVTITLDDVDADELGDAIEATLREIATFLHADGAFLFDTGARAANAYAGAEDEDADTARLAGAAGVWAWDASGAPGGESLAALVAGEEGRLRSLVEARRSGVFPAGPDVPGAFRGAGVRSLVVVPLVKGRDAEGCLGVFVRDADRPWSDGVLRRLRLLGDPIATALRRRRRIARTDEGSRFERLLGELTDALLDGDDADADDAGTDRAAESALQAIAEMAGGDRAVLFRVRRGGTGLEPDHFWADDTLDPPRAADYRREGSLRWLARRLADGEDVAVESVAELPPVAARERRHFRRAGCRSVLRIPLRAGERVVAVLGVDATLTERSWPADARERFRLAGRLLLRALDRGRGSAGGEAAEAVLSCEPLPGGPAAPPLAEWGAPLPGAPDAGAWEGPLGGLLPRLDRLPAGSSVLVLGDAERGRELVLRLPLPGEGGGAVWGLDDALGTAGALPAPPPAPETPASPPARPVSHVPAAPAPSPPPSSSLRDVERAHLLFVLQQCGWKINGTGNAADRLGLKPSTLRSRMKKLGIERPRGDADGAPSL